MCPVRGEPMGSPVDASHSRTLLSLMYPSPLHDAMTLPFGEKTTQLTRSEWPARGEPMGSPVVASHTMIVWSALHEASFLPVLSKQTPRTKLRIT